MEPVNMQFLAGLSVPGKMGSRTLPDVPTPVLRQGIEREFDPVREAPLQTFLGDIIVPAGSDQTIDVYGLMGNRCTGFIIISPAGTVQVAINGGGFRSVTGTMVVDQAALRTIRVITPAGLATTVQLHGI